MKALILFVAWCILFVLAWPVALLVLNCVYPLVPQQITSFCEGRRAVLVVGDGGIGKSRLLAEALQSALPAPARCALQSGLR